MFGGGIESRRGNVSKSRMIVLSPGERRKVRKGGKKKEKSIRILSLNQGENGIGERRAQKGRPDPKREVKQKKLKKKPRNRSRGKCWAFRRTGNLMLEKKIFDGGRGCKHSWMAQNKRRWYLVPNLGGFLKGKKN